MIEFQGKAAKGIGETAKTGREYPVFATKSRKLAHPLAKISIALQAMRWQP